jgi:hypothetical protein
MSLFAMVAVGYFFCASIHTFDKRINQARRQGLDEPALPSWIVSFSWAMFGLQVWLLVLDWRNALVLFAVAFLLAVLPVLEVVGNLLCSPLRIRGS